jgi:hypothetical protein
VCRRCPVSRPFFFFFFFFPHEAHLIPSPQYYGDHALEVKSIYRPKPENKNGPADDKDFNQASPMDHSATCLQDTCVERAKLSGICFFQDQSVDSRALFKMQ